MRSLAGAWGLCPSACHREESWVGQRISWGLATEVLSTCPQNSEPGTSAPSPRHAFLRGECTLKPFLEQCPPIVRKQTRWFRYLCLCKCFGTICDSHLLGISRGPRPTCCGHTDSCGACVRACSWENGKKGEVEIFCNAECWQPLHSAFPSNSPLALWLARSQAVVLSLGCALGSLGKFFQNSATPS